MTTQFITQLQDGIETSLVTAATATGDAISTAMSPITSSVNNATSTFATSTQNTINSLSTTLYDPNNNSGILYDVEQGVTSLGNNIQLGLSTTSAAVDDYTKATGDAITGASQYIFYSFLIISVALLINAFYVNKLDKTVKNPGLYPPSYNNASNYQQSRQPQING